MSRRGAWYPGLHGLGEGVDGRGWGLVRIDEGHRSEAAGVRGAVPQIKPWGVVGFTATPFRSVPRETISLFSALWYRYDITDAVRDGVLVRPRVERWGGESGTLIDDACIEMIAQHGDGPGIVSATSIQDAEDYADRLSSEGISAEAIHSQLTRTEQDARLDRLKAGEVRCLVPVS